MKGKPEQYLNPDHCQIQIRQEFWTWIILFWPNVFLGVKCPKVKRSFSTVNMYIKKNSRNLLVERLIEKFPGWNFKSRTATTRLLNPSFSSMLSTYSIIPWCWANSTHIITAGTYLIMNCDVASIELHVMAQQNKHRKSGRLDGVTIYTMYCTRIQGVSGVCVVELMKSVFTLISGSSSKDNSNDNARKQWLIGWMKKNNCAARTLVQFFDVVCQMKMWNFQI